MAKIKIALAEGDGIGPEIMSAALKLFEAAGVTVHIDFVPVEMGAKVFDSGDSRGMTDDAITKVEQFGLAYKGPMGTPTGGGGKSINVTLRKMYGAFANIRHFQSLPGVETVYSKAGVPIDFYVVRENIEDTYGGIEHRLTPDVIECKRLISAPGCDQVHNAAFQLAQRVGIRTVHCGHKANIMKLTDGLFLNRFHEVGKGYAGLDLQDIIIDALCMNLVVRPQNYKMVVLPNLQGDIVSDLAAGLVGGLGFAPSANLGDRICIFEAVHGTAPDIAGQNLANPTSLILSGIMMLRHVGLVKTAAIIENALIRTLEEGVHTGDFNRESDKPAVGTQEFAGEIIARLGKKPETREPASEAGSDEITFTPAKRPETNHLMQTFKGITGEDVGFDVYIDTLQPAKELARNLQSIAEGSPFELTMMSNRGTQVWPTGSVYTETVDYWRCRFELREKGTTTDQAPGIELFGKIAGAFKITDYQPLRMYDGKPGFSLAQGQ